MCRQETVAKSCHMSPIRESPWRVVGVSLIQILLKNITKMIVLNVNIILLIIIIICQ